MVQMTGNYQHEKNENVDDYFRAIGVPYIGRKMMAMSSPSMEISESGNEWSIKTSSLMRTNESKFKLNEEYEESMPGGLLKTTTVLDGDKLISTSVADEGTKIVRTYEFSDTHCIILLSHEKSGQVAKRYFKRL